MPYRYWAVSGVHLRHHPGRRHCIGTRPTRGPQFDSLEPRMLLAADMLTAVSGAVSGGPVHAIFAPGTPDDVIRAVEENIHGAGRDEFQITNRWTTTALSGSGLSQGDPTIITWGIVPDGTFIAAQPDIDAEEDAPSDLIARMVEIYGGDENAAPDAAVNQVWFTLFEQAFQSWSDLSGLTYVYEPNDDGVQIAGGAGSSGVRPDVRIGGHYIDGNSNILAYNWFPNNSDMVIDTADNFYESTGTNSLRLRNVLAHEAGHGLGFSHVISSNDQFLMEPYASTQFDGPQFDDILAANRLYGDPLEKNGGNDTAANAVNLGTLNNATATRGELLNGSNNPISNADPLSIDDNGDEDFFKFTVSSNASVTVSVSPVGYTYSQGPQGGSESSFNAAAQSNLSITLYDTNGSTVLTSINDAPAGSVEQLADYNLPGPGTYFIEVNGNANAAQMYEIEVTTDAPVAPTGIEGAVINDLDADGNLEGGEPGLGGWTVYLDENSNGQYDAGGVSVFASTDVPHPFDVPGDASTGTIESDLTVANAFGEITDVNVTLDIDHTWDEDVEVILIAPNGTQVQLFSFVGGSGDDFDNTTLDDEASTPIASGSAPFSGSYIPASALAAFDGLSPNGTWTLRVIDNWIGLDSGTLNAWSLQISTSSETSQTTASDGSYSFLNLPAGSYDVGIVPQSGYDQTTPAGATQTAQVVSGVVTSDVDFGVHDQTAGVRFALASSNASEPNGGHTIGVTLTTSNGQPLEAPVSVDVSDALTGDATSGSDYTAFGTKTVTFNTGERHDEVRHAQRDQRCRRRTRSDRRPVARQRQRRDNRRPERTRRQDH